MELVGRRVTFGAAFLSAAIFLSGAAAAQTTQGRGQTPRPSPDIPTTAAGPQNPMAAGAKAQFAVVSDFVIRAANKVPDTLYTFRPTPEVRSFAEIFGHVADAMFGMCGTADGVSSPHGAIEKVVTKKVDLVKALTDGAAYCSSVMTKMDDKRGAEPVQFYFGPTPRNSVLYFATAHAYEHYGNIVTYMRLNKIVPPSSEPGTPPRP
jgi:uncharacterized damage-inducible protein DinB